MASAEKLTTSAGAGVNPIYFSGGKPVACTYSLNKSVPSNAVFTDNNVTNTLATTTKAYITGTTSSTTNTGTQVFDTGVYLDTTAGMLTATTFKGNLSGTASNADTVDGLHADDFAKSVSPRITGDMVFQNVSNQNTINAIYSANDNLVLRNISKDGSSICDVVIGNDGVRITNATQNFIVGNGGNADTVDNMHVWTWGALNASGYFDGSDYLAAKYNFYGDGRYGIFSGSGTHVRCEYATNAGNVVSLRTHNSYADIFSTSLAYGHACWNKWTFISGQSTDSTAAGYIVNAPYSHPAIWYEVLTMGVTNRAFQLAIGCFTHQRHMFIRYMHDMGWSGWFKINTTAI